VLAAGSGRYVVVQGNRPAKQDWLRDRVPGQRQFDVSLRSHADGILESENDPEETLVAIVSLPQSGRRRRICSN
jgi:hypothetical protein